MERNLGRSTQNINEEYRIISLDTAPDGYDVQVTKLSNTQNKIDGKDFVTLDPQQDRIRRDLWMDGITYMYKGIMSPQSDKEVSMEEANETQKEGLM